MKPKIKKKYCDNCGKEMDKDEIYGNWLIEVCLECKSKIDETIGDKNE